MHSAPTSAPLQDLGLNQSALLHPQTLPVWSAWCAENIATELGAEVHTALKALSSIPANTMVLNLLSFNLPALPPFFQLPVPLSAEMQTMQNTWQASPTRPEKPKPWSKIPGVKVLYPAGMTGLNLQYIQNENLNTNEVWIIQRFLQRLYAKAHPEDFQNLEGMNWDECFKKAIYNGQSSTQNSQHAPKSILLPMHFIYNSSFLQIAAALNETVREDIYKQGFKSGNKQSNKQQEENDFYSRRRQMASMKIDGHRDAQKAAQIKNQPFNPATVFENQAQNCGELVEMAAMILEHCGFSSSLANFTEQNQDHVVLLIGGNLPMHQASVRWSELKKTIAVCDPWMNVACMASDYPKVSTQKLQKWTNAGKKLILQYREPDGTTEKRIEPNSRIFARSTFELKIHDLGPELLRQRKAALAQTSAPGA